MIVERMAGAAAEFAPSLKEAAEMLLDDLREGDVLMTMGAGDVWKAADAVLEGLSERGNSEEKSATPRAAATRHIPQAKGTEREQEKPTSPEPAAQASILFVPDLAERLKEATGLQVLRDEPMSKHDSLRIGGPASLFVTATTVEELVAAVLFARNEGVPYLVVGNGTNILVGDYGINGLVIHNRTRNISHDLVDEATSIWHVDSGVLFSRLARITCDAGWTGLEWSNSVPGSVGGGVVSNAGAHGKELKDDLVSVEVLASSGGIETWPVEDLALGYRTSRLKAPGRRALSIEQEVVLRAHLRLTKGSSEACETTMRRFLEERQAKQPQGKSAGSTFKNPPGSAAGYLIEQVGLKGHRHGQAQFSPKHANFMMNLGGATATEVLHLMDLARSRVREQFGIELEPEIEFIEDH
jgi:UDP-N-acetylmuramate dehydrogenase